MPDAVAYSDGSSPEAARTHVLLVGVGHYPNFANGARGGGAAPLGDLKSPPSSVRMIADWFISDYHYPPAPLGSLALLVSEDPPGPYRSPKGTEIHPPVPTYDCFAKEAIAWLKRGDGSEDSRLIFMFCGHGYGYGSETSLLMADFDFTSENAWDSALDLGEFKAGTEKFRASEQLFFIDACRRKHPDQMVPSAPIGRTPASATPNAREEFGRRRKAPVFFSTGNDEPARARKGDPSVFTQAFLRAMRGMGATDDDGPWQVSSLSMLKAMAHVSKRLTEGHFPDPQQPQGDEASDIFLHELDGHPVSPLYVKSQEPFGNGEIRYNLNGQERSEQCPPGDSEVALWLPCGEYDVQLARGSSVIARAPAARSSPMFKRTVLKP